MSGRRNDEIIYDQEGNVVQEGTTPTTSTAAPSTPQTYEQWVGAGTGSTAYQQGVGVLGDTYKNATETAEANKQLGISYAEGIKNSTYQSAEAARNEANRLADVNYQRNVIDSQSSYQKAVGVYGSNAETLASNGLSGSGYGEWLQGNAYATHRGQVQAAGAQRLSTQKEAAYNEQQTKLAADQTYGQFLYQNDVEYNNAMAAAKDTYNQGMYQLGLGLSESQNATYNDLFSKAASGQSIESIMQDGRWGDLTADQQKVITDRASKYISDADAAKLLDQNAINDDNYMQWLAAVNSGSLTYDQVAGANGFGALSELQQKEIKNAANTATWLTGIKNGTLTLSDIEQMEEYANLSDAQKQQLAGAEANKLKEQGEINSSNFERWVTAVGNGIYSLETVQAMDGYLALSDVQKQQIAAAAEKWSEKEQKAEDEAAAEQNSETYWAVYNAASNGADLASLQNDPTTWNALTEDQQKIITDITVANGIIDDLDTGITSAEAVRESEAYEALGEDAKRQVERHIAKTEAKNTQDANTALSSYLQMAQSGMSIDSITAIARANGHYATLAESDIWESIEKEATRASESIGNANYSSLLNSAMSGATIGQLQADGRWDTLNNAQKTEVLAAISAREAKEALANQEEYADKILTYRDMALGGASIQLIKDTMKLYDMEWDELGESEQRIIQSAVSAYEAARSKIVSGERAEQLLGLSEFASQGYDIDDIKGWAKIFGMGDLTEDELRLINSAISKHDALEEARTKGERADAITALANLASQGYSLETIKSWAAVYGIENLNETELGLISATVDSYAEAQEAIKSENELDRAWGYAGLIEAGWSLDDVKALLGEDGYDALSDEAKRIIGATSDVMTRINKETAGKEAKDALLDYYDLAASGVDIATIEAIAKNYGHYDALEDTWGAIADTSKAIAEIARNDAAIGYVESMAGIDFANPDEARTWLQEQGIKDTKMQDSIIKVWEVNNISEFSSMISNVSFKTGLRDITAESVLSDLNSGIYGSSAQSVINAYINNLVKATNSESATLADAIWAMEQLSKLGRAAGNGLYDPRKVGEKHNDIKNVFAITEDKQNANGTVRTINGVDFTEKNYTVDDQNVLAELNKIGASEPTIAIVWGKYYKYDTKTKKWYRRERVKVS